ncbi:MAG: nuclear transport factor 2 family protein [Opitutus sp.]
MNSPRLLYLLASLLLGSLTGYAAAANDEASIAAVLGLNQARNVALVAHDLKALDRILAPDFNYTHSTNTQETKATHLDSLVKGLLYEKFATSALRAHVITPEVITLNGIFDQIKGKPGNMKEARYLFLAVWRKTGDTWQLTTLQSALPPPAPAAVAK